MHKLTHKLKELGGRRIAFSLVVLAYLGFLGFINVMMLLPGNWMSAMGHFSFINTGDTHNLIHELVFALIVGTAAVGLFSQLWKPKENFAGQLIAMIAWVTMIFTAAITNNWVPQPLFIIFGGLTLIATILHPAGLGLFNWIRIAKVNKILLTLVVIAAVPLFMFAATNINLQTGGEGITFGIDIDHQGPAMHGGSSSADNIEMVKQQYGGYTVAQAEREGYILDTFCLNAESFGKPAELGAMGYHATNEALLAGPIDAKRPQAFMFDAEGRVLGVEYEIMAEMVSEPPQLFGQTFTKLPPHPGVAHEHYALHVWFIDNPSGQFTDFNPDVSCPPDSTPSMDSGGMTMDNAAGHDDQEHIDAGHYRNMAALGFIIILLGLLASFKPQGWRVAAWIAGFLPIFLGLASVVLPDAESSLGLGWSFAAVVWGIVFFAAAEFTRRKGLNETQEL
ncbi:MAG: hypothetical protein UX06_C0029G0011 [Candidatus Giovannonibacteria bacterium GW2011_GWA2_45_21]|uniref:Uncharacterized protein n=1 Tax=Candidatus Giovannonibacteria bacterium GW2011_GWA2_45_21 TaxID=1618649 RepID=A0A0G1Q5V1_9BACT|nr:MAG: hypothetical protein UX06_C0029G0011 [Candidatus Giovannonibacteria bacterium GW2011_GWA2_45_21]